MAVFTLTQKIFVVKCYYKGGESVRQVLGCLQRRFGKMFGEENVEAILQIILMFETAGSIVDRVELIEPLNAPKHLKESDEFEEEITETAVMELSGGESTESEEELEEEDISQTSTTNDNLSDAPSSSATKQQPKAKEAQNPTDLPDNNRLCPECGETYHSKDFRKHQKTHTKPTTYECDVCHKVLQSKYNLMNHLKIHRELRTEEQYICEICAKAFKTSYQLNKHQVVRRRSFSLAIRKLIPPPISDALGREAVRVSPLPDDVQAVTGTHAAQTGTHWREAAGLQGVWTELQSAHDPPDAHATAHGRASTQLQVLRQEVHRTALAQCEFIVVGCPLSY